MDFKSCRERLWRGTYNKIHTKLSKSFNVQHFDEYDFGLELPVARLLLVNTIRSIQQELYNEF